MEGCRKAGKRKRWGLHMELGATLGGVCILNGSQVYHGTSGSVRRGGTSHRVGIVGVGKDSTMRSAERDVAAVKELFGKHAASLTPAQLNIERILFKRRRSAGKNKRMYELSSGTTSCKQT